MLKLEAKVFEAVAPHLWPKFGNWETRRTVGTIKSDLSEWEVEGQDG